MPFSREFQTVTAGKYKRTLTPTKKVTKEDFDKEQQGTKDYFHPSKSIFMTYYDPPHLFHMEQN
jgi:hypothetical protein